MTMTTPAPAASTVWPTRAERAAAAAAPTEGRILMALRGAFYLSWALVATMILAVSLYAGVQLYQAKQFLDALFADFPTTSAPVQPGEVDLDYIDPYGSPLPERGLTDAEYLDRLCAEFPANTAC